METEARSIDPRVKRTRKLLQQAFMELLQEKTFASISILDITERATVNRATFYAHFSDKYALMDSTIREQFQQSITSQFSATSGWRETNVRILIRDTANFLSDLYHHCKPSDMHLNFLSGQAIQQEVVHILLNWLKQAKGKTQRRVQLEAVASAMSWTILGATIEWVGNEQQLSLEEITNQTTPILTEGIARLVPGLSPQE